VNPERGLFSNPTSKSGGLLHGSIEGHVVMFLPHKLPYEHHQRIESFVRVLNEFLSACSPPIGNAISWQRAHIVTSRTRSQAQTSLV
jgi:hypothetical protein